MEAAVRRSARAHLPGAAAFLIVLTAAAPGEVALDLKRDPAAQAREAIGRGDFRVARMVYRYEEEHIHFGEGTPGLACDSALSDEASRDLPWDEGTGRSFAAAYNRTLAGDPSYPDPDICVATGREAAGENWPDFARLRARPAAPERSVNRAARAARPDLVRALIAAGKPFDSYDRWKRRPLHWAARRGDTASLDILLAAGARPDDGLDPGSALLLAADAGRRAAVERLLEGGADPDACGDIDARDSWGDTLSGSTRRCPLAQAIEQGRAEVVRSLVRHAVTKGSQEQREKLVIGLYRALRSGKGDIADAFLDSSGAYGEALLQPAVLRVAAYRLDGAMLRRLMARGGAAAARTPAEARLWLAAAKLRDPRPLALLVWFGGRLNYLSSAERARIERSLPALSPEALRPWLARAAARRKQAIEAVAASDLGTLTSLAAAGLDLAERHDDTLLSRAAMKADSATVRWLLANGARADSVVWEYVTYGCSSIAGELDDEAKSTRAQRAAFQSLCEAELEDREPAPDWPFGRHALQNAVAADKLDAAGLLLARSNPAAALAAIQVIVEDDNSTAIPAGRLGLLPALARLAARGDRVNLAYELADLLWRKDGAGARAVLEGYAPAGLEEIAAAFQEGERGCRIASVELLRARGVDLAGFRETDGRNLFALFAPCDSADLVAAIAAIPGIDVNAVDDDGNTPLELVPSGKSEGPGARALRALGARECDDLHERERCRARAIAPDPAL